MDGSCSSNLGSMKNVCARDSLEDSCIAFYQVSTEDSEPQKMRPNKKNKVTKKQSSALSWSLFMSAVYTCLCILHVSFRPVSLQPYLVHFEGLTDPAMSPRQVSRKLRVASRQKLAELFLLAAQSRWTDPVGSTNNHSSIVVCLLALKELLSQVIHFSVDMFPGKLHHFGFRKSGDSKT